MASVFLKAEWRKLVMANYAIEPDILKKYVPRFTELDLWEGKCYVSLVAFMFCNTKVKGLSIPFHINFEEVNLRFYVKHLDKSSGEWRRGVVFIREFVPKAAITWVARTLYEEPYSTISMDHRWKISEEELKVKYSWKLKTLHTIEITADAKPSPIEVGSEEEFITEHYWGYTGLRSGKTAEYGVEHPRWEVYPMKSYNIQADFETLYGKDFAMLNTQTPDSVFLAEGSEIIVRGGQKLD